MRKNSFALYSLQSILLCICMLCTSCSDYTELPQVSEQELLTKISNDTSCLGISLAKELAEQELQEGMNTFLDIQNYSLSNMPRVIFAYDNRPKYYEFDVLVNDQPQATITTFAQKEEEACIAFVFNTPLQREYRQEFVMYEGFYPTVYWGKLGEYGGKPCVLYKEDGVTLVDEIPSIYEDERYERILKQMDSESATQARSIVTRNKEQRLNKRQRTQEYWDSILTYHLQMNTIKTKDNGIHSSDIVNGTPASYYVIPSYDKENLKRTRWHGYCGPAVVAWIYRGLFSHYPCNSTSTTSYIHVHGDADIWAYRNGLNEQFFGSTNNNVSYYDYDDEGVCYDIYKHYPNNVSQQIDNGLYEALLSHTVKTGNAYPMYQAGMNNAIKEITNGKYCIATTTNSRSYITDYHLPVIIMIGTGDSFHYLVAFGAGKTKTKKYIYVTDNGTFISGNHYYPYWRYEGSNYGIRYKFKVN